MGDCAQEVLLRACLGETCPLGEAKRWRVGWRPELSSDLQSSRPVSRGGNSHVVFFPVLMIDQGLLCRMKAGAQFRPPKFTASLLWREFARAPFDTGLVSAVFMFCFKVASCLHGTHRCFRRSDSTDSLCFFALAELISTIINA